MPKGMTPLLTRLGYDPRDPGGFWGPVLGYGSVAVELAVLVLNALGVINLPWLAAVALVPGAWVLFWIGCIVLFVVGLLLGRVDMR